MNFITVLYHTSTCLSFFFGRSLSPFQFTGFQRETCFA
ncbi:unnamed protein product [Brassica oleracea]